MAEERLIFDIGMHLGEDLQFYLHNNARVVAVDADPVMIELALRKFNHAIKSGKLTLVNKAMSNEANVELKFNISSDSFWNSLDAGIADRKDKRVNEISVQSITLPDLIKQYGVPYYCKIDIEGMDNACLQTLKNIDRKPQFISAETECLTEDNSANEDDYLKTLNTLHSLGYNKFQLIDQNTLQPLDPDKKFYENHFPWLYYANKILGKAGVHAQSLTYRHHLSKKFNYEFPFGSSGVYGEMLRGKWYGFEDAKKMLLKHRRDYFNLKKHYEYGFWCDWHATV